MKHNFKKFISLFLTICILLGTMVVIAPISASADDVINITPNTDFEYNGQTFRFQTKYPEESSAKIQDGKLVLTMKRYDVFWISSLTVKDATSSYTFENMTTSVEGAKLAVMNHVTTTGSNKKMYSSCWDSASAWLCGRWEWGDYNQSIWICNYDAWGGAQNSWGGSSTPASGNSFDGVWSTSDVLSVRTTFENWSTIVPRTFFYEGRESLDGLVSNYQTETNFRWYPQLDTCVGTSFGLSLMTNATVTITIDKITATNMTETDSYVETFEPEDEDAFVLTPNADNWINGHNYRFETKYPEESSAKIQDGKLVLTMKRYDVFWIPSLTVKDATSSYTFENMTTSVEGAKLAVMNHVTTTGSNKKMYSSCWDSASAWLCGRWEWGDYNQSIWISNYDAWGGAQNSWGGSSTPASGNSFDGVWSTSDVLSVRTTFENWSTIVPRTYFYDETSSLSEVVSNIDTDTNFRWYPQLDTCVGTSFGLSLMTNATVTITIDKITATNMTETDSYVETFDTAVAPSVGDAATSLSLNGTIGLNFRFEATALPAPAILVVTKNGEEISNALASSYSNGAGVYTVSAPVNAKEMGDSVNFSVKLNGSVYSGLSYTTSVEEYATALLANPSYSEWYDLIGAMLNYGAAAQKVLDYKAGDLVADISGGVSFDFSDVESLSITGNTSYMAGIFSTLTLESDTALNLYFKTKNGEALTATVNSAAAPLTTTDDGYLRLTIRNLAAEELSDEYVIVINGELYITISAIEWAKFVVGSDESADMKTLANALAAYSAAADAKKK